MKKHPSWKRLNRKTIYDTPHLRVYEDAVELPNGQRMDDYSVIEKNDVVAVVATDESGRLLMLEEYRYPVDETLYNLPAGTILRGAEDLQAVAERELREETGYTSNDISYIGSLYDYPTKDTHIISIFRAKNAVKTHETMHEASEQIHLTLMEIEEVKKLLFENKIAHAATFAEIVLGFPELFGKN